MALITLDCQVSKSSSTPVLERASADVGYRSYCQRFPLLTSSACEHFRSPSLSLKLVESDFHFARSDDHCLDKSSMFVAASEYSLIYQQS